jgi:hypothetical protein
LPRLRPNFLLAVLQPANSWQNFRLHWRLTRLHLLLQSSFVVLAVVRCGRGSNHRSENFAGEFAEQIRRQCAVLADGGHARQFLPKSEQGLGRSRQYLAEEDLRGLPGRKIRIGAVQHVPDDRRKVQGASKFRFSARLVRRNIQDHHGDSFGDPQVPPQDLHRLFPRLRTGGLVDLSTEGEQSRASRSHKSSPVRRGLHRVRLRPLFFR